MLRIDRASKSFSQLETPTLADASITERYDLQEFICNSPDAFFGEIGQALFLVGKEIPPSKSIQDRIDLLAIDKEGAGVVIELKRGGNKLHMMQAVSYAGLVAHWSAADFIQLLDEGRQDLLANFLDVSLEEVNSRQKIILVAESFDLALLAGAEWLSERHGVDITCCRISLAMDTLAHAHYLVCSNIFPIPELAREAAPRGRRAPANSTVAWADWDEALADVDNGALVSYFTRELANGRESNLGKRALFYRHDGKRRWEVQVRKTTAYAWQVGRFDGDIAYWEGGLGGTANVAAVKAGSGLSFSLSSLEDFQFFHGSVSRSLRQTVWLEGPGDLGDEGEGFRGP